MTASESTITAPRRLIAEVRFGPLSSKKVVLEPGQTVKVGRAAPADLVAAQDVEMSVEHLAISWDGERCRVKDLSSAKGTFAQGVRIEDAEIPSGAWIRAGTTHLMVYFERPPTALSWTGGQRDALAALRAESLPLFAVVDAAHGLEVLSLLRESVDRHQSLYDGVQGEALALVAPYLVALRPDSALLERLVHDGWSKRWAIYLTSSRPFTDVRRHLRRFLITEIEGSTKKYLLRFYDPAVLPTLLAAASTRQRQQIFGDVASFFAPASEPAEALVRFTSEELRE